MPSASPGATGEARPSQRAAWREATRVNILRAARRLCEQVDVGEVTLEAIAAAAEVSRATVYQHFAGKTALLVALLTQDWENQARLFGRLGDGVRPPDAEQIQAWLERVIEGLRKALGSFGVHRAAMGSDVGVAGMRDVHRRRLAAILRERLVPDSARRDDLRDRIVFDMLINEIEYVMTQAVVAWSPAEADIAVGMVTRNMLDVASGHNIR